ncbi:uncharacterized protein LOC108930902 [Scleropages formosus]|uniref:uncharacterized protein LOC108930902 n=1 Tax=Scleropages formosus TaxID=113540 RepID=UPI0010FA9E8B|nr:uncharacterized protein LOC108930902 [Scleropages formosus]
MERVASRVILVLLLGFFPRGCWEIIIDLETCLQFQLNSVLITCSVEHSPEDSPELWGECMLDEGVEACMHCAKSYILDEFLQDTHFTVHTFDSQMKTYKFLEFLVTVIIQATTDCVQLGDHFDECFGIVFAERLMTNIRLIINENFLYPEFVRCWAEKTVDDAIRCSDVLSEKPAIRFGTAANVQDRRKNDFMLCTLKHGINSTVVC